MTSQQMTATAYPHYISFSSQTWENCSTLFVIGQQTINILGVLGILGSAKLLFLMAPLPSLGSFKTLFSIFHARFSLFPFKPHTQQPRLFTYLSTKYFLPYHVHRQTKRPRKQSIYNTHHYETFLLYKTTDIN